MFCLFKFVPIFSSFLSRKYDNAVDEFENELCIVAIAKNEAPYFQEWIEFHKLAGVQKFYIYDNESDDNTKEVLKPYIEDGTVEYRFFPGDRKQVAAYKDCIKKHKNETKWLAIIDIDEFIVPVKHKTILDYLKDCDNYAQIEIQWVLFGSSGHKTKPNGLVIENFKHRVKQKNSECKSIVNPRKVVFPHIHISEVYGHTCNEIKQTIEKRMFQLRGGGYFRNSEIDNFEKDIIRVHHYYGKSYDEYCQKKIRGDAFFTVRRVTAEEYIEWDEDKNEVYDDIMDKYIEPIKQSIAKREKGEIR
jgi:hypothetical protein